MTISYLPPPSLPWANGRRRGRSLLDDVRAATKRAAPQAPPVMIRPVSAHEFDSLSAQVAAAYSAGDERQAQRIAQRAVADHALPRLRRLVCVVAARPDLRDESLAHSLLRIADAWKRGREVHWAEFERIVRGAVADMAERDRKHAAANEPEFESAGARDVWLARNAANDVVMTAGPDQTVGDSARVEQLATELDDLGRPQLAALVRATLNGATSGTELGEQLGVAGGRVRQLRMELRAYIADRYPDLLPVVQGADQ